MKLYSLLAILAAASKASAAPSADACTLSASGEDDAPAFVNAVKTCPLVTVPKSTTLLINTRLNTTGLANTKINLAGTLKFKADTAYWAGNGFYFPFQTQITFWILGGKNITLTGGGTLDGSGQAWYDAFAKNSSLLRPITLTITQATTVRVDSINFINGPEWHNLVNESKDVVYNNITINAKSTSSNDAKNTDGWNIYRSDTVTIQNSVINNGDDCVAFKPNATNVLVQNLSCTGSHGISVGSLGQYAGIYDIVQNVLAKNITMANAQNGARIKAWAGKGVGSGLVKNITFQGFTDSKVDLPVVIDQCYETSASDCSKYPSNTYIQDIWFNSQSGTSSGSKLASIGCSPDDRCSNINVNDFSLKAILEVKRNETVLLESIILSYAMKLPNLAIFLAATLKFAHATDQHGHEPHNPCKLVASGGDDAPAFVHAVRTCPVVTIPKSETLLINTRLNTTNLRNRKIDLAGTLKFKNDTGYWAGNGFYFPFQTQITFWILGGENIELTGGGTLDGSGQAWYDEFAINSTLLRPIILTVTQSKNVRVTDINYVNGPEWNNLVNESKNVIYNNITVNAKSTSSVTAKNTDGWNIYRSDHVTITNSVINNGDDCVAFKPNATNVYVANLNCTGSHGISVGSLGQYPGVYDIVQNVTAVNIRMSNAQNGARIKAWAGPNVGGGLVKNITFLGFIQSKVDLPVTIDQCYFTNATACAEYPSNTYIQDVWFDTQSGSSSGANVAKIACSPHDRCSNINVNNFDLTAGSGTATYSCQNIVLRGNAASLFPNCTVTA